MANPIRGPRKQRTRQHVIADLSAHYVEGFILEEGHTAQRLGSDYGYDLILWTFCEEGYPEPGSIYFQLKAAEALKEQDAGYVHDVDVRDYNLWIWEKNPVILVLFDATRIRAYWLYVQGYFRQDPGRRPRKDAKSVRVRIPKRQTVNRRAIATIRTLKQEAQGRLWGVQS
jgi:hypothetical protein